MSDTAIITQPENGPAPPPVRSRRKERKLLPPSDFIETVQVEVSIGGDMNNVVVRGNAPHNQTTVPEIAVLEYLHGEGSVNREPGKIVPVGWVRRTTAEEKQRLLGIYAAETVERLYPGARPIMERSLTGEPPPDDVRVMSEDDEEI